MTEMEPVVKTIETVHKVSVKEVAENTDPFNVSLEKVNDLRGLSATFRRGVSREINKIRQSANGEVSSKQLNDYPYNGYDKFGVVSPPHSLETFIKIYEMAPAHYAAVEAKVFNIVGLGYMLVESNKTKRAFEELDSEQDEQKSQKSRRKLNNLKESLIEYIENLNSEDTFTETLIKVWTDYEVTGNGYLEVGRNIAGEIGYIGHVPAHTLRIRQDRDGFVQISGNKAQFFANYGDRSGINPIGDDTPNEIIHFKNYSPSSTYYGVPDIIAAQQEIAGNEFASRYNLEYFENKAVPRYVITLKGAELGRQALQDILTFFETGVKGTNHRSIIIPLPNGTKENPVEFKMDAVEAKVQDSSFSNYTDKNTNGILMVHRVPITKVSISSGNNVSVALARDADKTFKEQVCSPRQKIVEKKIGRLFRELTDAFDFKLAEMTLTDEDTQSKIDERYRKMGVTTSNEVRIPRGLPSRPDGDTLFDLNKSASTKAEETTNRQRDAERSAGGTDSNGEARNSKGEGRAVN